MPFRFDRRLTGLALTLAVLIALSACGGKKRPPVLAGTPGGGPGPAEAAERAPAQPVDEGPDVRAVQGEGTEGSDIAGQAAEGGPLADIHFVYDSAALTDEARATLEKHALWLQGHREARVTIEGHCDERGTVEYNQALGEKRANAARDYLVAAGVAANRVQTLSYGKERPFAEGHDESAWAQNRRANPVVR